MTRAVTQKRLFPKNPRSNRCETAVPGKNPNSIVIKLVERPPKANACRHKALHVSISLFLKTISASSPVTLSSDVLAAEIHKQLIHLPNEIYFHISVQFVARFYLEYFTDFNCPQLKRKTSTMWKEFNGQQIRLVKDLREAYTKGY